MKIHRILALVLVLALAVTLCAACSGTTETTEPVTSTTTAATTGTQETSGQTSGQTTATQETTAQSETTPAELPELELTVNAWSINTFDPEADAFAKIIKDKFKLIIKPVILEGDGLKLAAASKSLPDIFGTGPLWDVTTFNSWVNQGIVRDIPEDMLHKYPTISQHMTNNRSAVAARELYGKYWYLVVPNCLKDDVYKVKWSGIYYRKDWMANVGITEVPSTFDELYTMLKAFVENDPNQNGKDDTYGITLNGGMWFFSEWFTNWGVDTEGWQIEDGQWIPGYLSRKNIEPLKLIQKMFHEGLIDTEFTTNNPTQAMQKFSGDTFGVILRNADTYWMWNVIKNQFGGAHKEIQDPFTVVGLLPPMSKDASSEPAIAEAIDHDGVQFRAGLEDEKLDRYLALHDWLMTDEARYYKLGFEGEHYSKDSDGKIVTFNDPNTGRPYAIWQMYPATGLLDFVTWGLDTDADLNWPSLDYREDLKMVAKEFRDANNQYPYQVNIEPMFISTPAKDTFSFDAMGEFALMVMGDESIDTAFETFITKAMDAGARQAIDELNAEANRLGID